MEEIWKDIPNYKGYQVSNFGRIRTYNKTTYTNKHGVRHWKDRVLKERIDKKNNCLSVQLYKNGKGKSYLIHRIVGEVFLGDPKNNKMTINHKDGNRLNNNVNNLEWLSLADNIRHGFDNDLYTCKKKIKLTNKKDNTIKIFRSMVQASKEMGKNKGYISGKIIKKQYENNFYRWEVI